MKKIMKLEKIILNAVSQNNMNNLHYLSYMNVIFQSSDVYAFKLEYI